MGFSGLYRYFYTIETWNCKKLFSLHPIWQKSYNRPCICPSTRHVTLCTLLSKSHNFSRKSVKTYYESQRWLMYHCCIQHTVICRLRRNWHRRNLSLKRAYTGPDILPRTLVPARKFAHKFTFKTSETNCAYRPRWSQWNMSIKLIFSVSITFFLTLSLAIRITQIL
jgi:hypothetical protein